MRKCLFLLGIAAAAAAPAGLAQSGPAAQATATSPVHVARTVRVGKDGVEQPATRSVAGGPLTTVRVEPDGRVVETPRQGRGIQRVLVELRARPLLDRVAPGSAPGIAAEQSQLAADLQAIDAQVLSATPAQITRQYQLLFSGVAATMSAEAADAVRRLPYVAAVYDDVEVHGTLTESVPLIGAPTIWSDYGVTGAGVKVAIIDTGVDYTHPDLGGCFGAGCRVVGGYDFVNGDGDPFDDFGHGTHVAGIVGANGTLKGVAPAVTFLAYKVLDSGGSGYSSNIIAGMERAVTDGAKVANLSLGGSGGPDDPMSTAVDNATAAGMLSVIAAGNSGSGYQTIGSPGAARTALTVGASSKTDTIAAFSSRGPVLDGEHFLMKPEVVAPGVSIRSTVPAAGRLGDASRYASLNGTSMATPHAAGAAALLLQWNSAQSPGDLKNRLAASSRTIGENAFTQGAGRIDLPAAFALPVAASVAHLDFGTVTDATGVVSRQQTFAVRNTTTTTQSLSLAPGGPALPTGTTLDITPSAITLQPGQSTSVTVQLRVDVSITPDATAEPMSYDAVVVIAAGSQRASVPVYFLKGPVLALDCDKPPDFVWLINPSLGASKYLDHPRVPYSTLIPRGTWDVMVGFDGHTTVVREQQLIEHRLALTVQSAEGVRSITVNAVDHALQPMDHPLRVSVLVLALRNGSTGAADAALFWMTDTDHFNASGLSSRYAVGVVGGMWAPDRARFYSYSWTGSGLSGDVALPAGGNPIRRVVQGPVVMEGATTWITMLAGAVVGFGGGGFGIYTGYGFPSTQTISAYLQSVAESGLPAVMSMYASALGSDPVTQAGTNIYGPYMRQNSDNLVELNRGAFFNLFDPSRDPDATLAPDLQRWDIDAPPKTLPLRFANTASGVRADGRDFTVSPAWTSQALGSVGAISGIAPSFDLYRNGVLLGTYPVGQLGSTIASTAASHEMRSTQPYRVGGTLGSSQVVAAFDTRNTDSNPPFVSQFRIEQNDVRTATPLASAPTRVTFEVSDDTELASVALEWRPAQTTAWVTLPLTKAGAEYSRVFQQEGTIDLRVTAADASGNTFTEEWTPAFVAATAAGSPLFTDDPLQAGITPVKAVHIQEMRNLIGTLRARYGLRAYTFTDPALSAGTTGIKAVHVSELRTALQEVYDAAGLARPVYSHPTITPGTTRGPTVVDLAEIRAAILAIY